MSKKGIIHIYASHNNTMILLTDITGAETIAKCSGGEVIKAQHKEGSPYAAMKIAETIAEKARERNMAAIKSLTRAGLRIVTIENVTPVPHNGCRKKKKFRGKKK